MSHHERLIIKGIDYGYVRITNAGQIISIYITQPWGESELLVSRFKLEEEE